MSKILVLKYLFTLQMPMDKYSKLDLLRFQMDMIENIVDYMSEGSWHTQAMGLEEDEGDDIIILDSLAKTGDLAALDLLSKSAALPDDPLLDKMDW